MKVVQMETYRRGAHNAAFIDCVPTPTPAFSANMIHRRFPAPVATYWALGSENHHVLKDKPVGGGAKGSTRD